MSRFALVGALAALSLSFAASAYDPKKVEVTGHELPQELQSVGVEEHLGNSLDLSLPFTDDQGNAIALGQLFHRRRPVLLAMIYYSCPSLCNLHLNGLTETMKALKWTAGQEFDVVAVSMDHKETADLARAKKETYLKEYGRPEATGGWHFLVGAESSVKALAGQLGFKFKWLEDKNQFAHAAVAYVVTPEGKISRYLHGVQPEVTTLRMSLLEAANGAIGSPLEQVLMFCFKFDPRKNKYTIYAWNVMRLGALVMVLLLAVLLMPVWWREKRR